VEFLITWALVLGLLVAPALVNYYVNRYFTQGGTLLAPTLEVMIASLVLTFALVVAAVLGTVAASLAWKDLEDEIAAFIQLGLVGYGQDRPIALSGVLSAVSIALMSLMGLLGVMRIPSRFIR
jgi:hypothetical protein